MQVNEINGRVIVCPLVVQTVHQLRPDPTVSIGLLDGNADEMATNDTILNLVEEDSPDTVTNWEILLILNHEIEMRKGGELVSVEANVIILREIPLVAAH